MNQDTLVVTPTLGKRISSLCKTIETVSEYGGDRVKHLIIAPKNKVDEIKKLAEHISVVEEPKDCKSIYGALNFAFKNYGLEYEYLTFINDDDHWLPNYSFLFQELDRSTSIDVVYGKVKYINKEGSDIGEQTSSSRYKAFKYLLANGIILFTQQAVLIRKEVYFKNNGFDESYKLIADTKFWLQSIEQEFSFKFINKCCSTYMIQEGQLSSNSKLQKSEHLKLRREYNLDHLSIYKKKFETLFFRFTNLNIYLRRAYRFDELKMRKLFHKQD